MIPFEQAIEQARVALTALETARIALGTAYTDLDQDTDWDDQSPESIIEAQELLRVLENAYYRLEGVNKIIK